MVTTMLIKIRKTHDVFSSEITPEPVYRERRKFLKKSGYYALAGLGFAMSGCSDDSKMNSATELVSGYSSSNQFPPPGWLDQKVKGFNKSQYQIEEPPTPFNDVAGYNNFYEFGAGKTDPAKKAGHFKTDPWSVVIEGEVEKPGTYTLEDLLKPHTMEERIYRLRCVEAWSMVIPWVGFSLGDLLKRFNPTSRAKFVEFTTLFDPEQMPGQKNQFGSIHWPYVEGLRMDEAMHPLTLLAVGLYGQVLPNQNGAPFRLVVPWKYGFKSIKSIVKIRLLEQQPKTTWEIAGPSEYGFYANVNPAVDHPRWSQKTERRLPGTLLNPNRINTQLFNGYEEEVAGLYKGMDLKRYF